MAREVDLLLETSRLLMRPLTRDDADDWWRVVWRDPEVTRYLPPRGPLPPEQASARLERVSDHWRTHGIGVWSIREKSQGSILGHCGLVVNEPPDVELIYALGRAAWGRGLATEAARSVVTFAFERRGLDEIFAFAVPENGASARVLDKLGFVLQDEIARDGVGLLRYILRNDRIDSSAV